MFKRQLEKFRNLPSPYPRVITGFIGFGLILLMTWSGLLLMAPAYLFLCIVGFNEYCNMVGKRGIPIRKRSAWVAIVLTLPASLPVTYMGIIDMQPLFLGVSWRELLLGLFLLYLIGLEVINPNENSMQAILYTFFGYIYIPWMFGYAITLRYTPDGVLGLWYFILPILAINASDIGGYVFGKMYGRQKLAPGLSPNKTLEGSIGGLLFAIFIVSSVAFVIKLTLSIDIDLYDTFLFAILVASSAQLGDLFASMLKRWAGVKDSGTIFPGHGGVLDRIDGMLFAVPITYYFVTLVILR